VGKKVYAKNFGHGQHWLPSMITEVTGPISFMVKLQDGCCVRRIRIKKTDATRNRAQPELAPLDDVSITTELST
jgi:hypothetical protein